MHLINCNTYTMFIHKQPLPLQIIHDVTVLENSKSILTQSQHKSWRNIHSPKCTKFYYKSCPSFLKHTVYFIHTFHSKLDTDISFPSPKRNIFSCSRWSHAVSAESNLYKLLYTQLPVVANRQRAGLHGSSQERKLLVMPFLAVFNVQCSSTEEEIVTGLLCA